MSNLPRVLLLLALVSLVGLVGWLLVRSPLRRATVERFARRQRIVMADGNATHVVGALGISHRWRRAGLVVGLFLGALWSLRQGELTLYFLAGFLGWFAGAVIAEWRIGRLDEPGERRSAVLAPRGITTYLTPLIRTLAGGALGLAAVAAVAALVRSGFSMSWLAWVLYVVLLVVVLGLTARAIVERPSGFVDESLRDADDALRCHGLTVLAGAGIAAMHPPVVEFLVRAAYPFGVPSSMDPLWTLLVMVVLLVLGYWVATRSPSARESRAVRQAPDAAVDHGAATA
ncbi:MAG: hypothetical protein Q4G67_06690 [Actinomycetia bacterium]|nr:hypothetical protein [Actinomycetes bacterium]MDO5502847.1 hypothetical protein [Actinomycetes bacterium]